MLYYLRSERSWDFLYGIAYGYFSFFALTPIRPRPRRLLREQN
ncbi:MAG: hypothetical protein ACM3SO_03975 [Betaproteobacteria bacterium]